jgi:putative FmdB family regulatory protein
MPLYGFRCGEGHGFDRMLPLARYREPQTCECGAPAQRVIEAPRVLSDCIEPIMGADGKMHDSLASYRHSLTPAGNPKGERYLELGNESLPDYRPPKPDLPAIAEAVKAGIADVKAGRTAPVVTGDLP